MLLLTICFYILVIYWTIEKKIKNDLAGKLLKILMMKSEAINRRTENTMTKKKRTKRNTTIYKTLHRKLKIEQHEPHYNSNG
jgi:hypothetical protein